MLHLLRLNTQYNKTSIYSLTEIDRRIIISRVYKCWKQAILNDLSPQSCVKAMNNAMHDFQHNFPAKLKAKDTKQ